MAKAAGEVLCQELTMRGTGIRAVSRRLPRMSTDQTMSLLTQTDVSAVDIMVPIIREIQETAPQASV